MTQTKTETKIVRICTEELITLEAALQRISKAVRVGKLDWEGCYLQADLTFEKSHPEQSFASLEALVDEMDTPYGIDMRFIDPGIQEASIEDLGSSVTG